jgi:hypothetical protein
MSVESARRGTGVQSMRMLFACSLFALAAAAGFAEGSWEDASMNGGREYSISDFTAVETGSGIEVRIEQSDEYRVTLFASEGFMDRIRVERTGETLRIRVVSWFPFGFLSGPFGSARVEITMPRLERVRASGGAPVTLHMDEGGAKVAVELSGGSRCQGTLRCAALSLGASGGGRADMQGSADDLVLYGSGGAVFTLGEFTVRRADVRLAGGSSARLMAQDELSVEGSGGSHVTYRGSPSLHRQSLSGGSWIRGE